MKKKVYLMCLNIFIIPTVVFSLICIIKIYMKTQRFSKTIYEEMKSG